MEASGGRLTRSTRGWRLDLVDVEPTLNVLRSAVEAVASQGGGELQWWQSRPTPRTDALASDLGLTTRRDLLQVKRPLPDSRYADPPLVTRPFVPGQDEDAWLEVNNRAFGWHPEQGGWDAAMLAAREGEPWFDPDGFLLYEEDGRLAGFCWTKVHDAAMGEIYVIAVDPDFSGRGLGRRLTVAGLDYLAGRGLTVGMLYVDASNLTARSLYDKLGFTLDHIDRAYSGDVQAAPDTPTTAPIA